MINNLKTAIASEAIKYNNSGFKWIIGIFAIMAPLLFIFVFFLNDLLFPDTGFPYNYYNKGFDLILPIFVSFFYPLFILVCAVRLAQIEHKRNAWRLMETQPLSKISIYLTKFYYLLLSNLAVIILFTLFSILEFFINSWFMEKPEIASFHVEIGTFLSFMIRLFLSSLAFNTLIFVMAMIIPNAIASISMGFGLMLLKFIGTTIAGIPLRIYPLSFIIAIDKVENPSNLGHFLTWDIYIGFLMCFIILAVGYIYFKHKNIYYTFVKNKGRTATIVTALILSGILIYFLAQPRMLEPFHKTVVKGNIDSDEPIKTVSILDNFENVILSTPVQNNEFTFKINQNFPLDDYRVLIDNKATHKLIFGNKDSIFIQIKWKNLNFRADIKGTRVAENLRKGNPLNQITTDDFMKEKDLGDPSKYLQKLLKNYNINLKLLTQFRTADNLIPRKDFLDKEKKIINIVALNQWNNYVDQRKDIKGENTETPTEIQEMKSSLKERDAALLAAPIYANYVRHELIANDHRDIDELTKYREALINLPDSEFRNRALSLQIEANLRTTNDTLERLEILKEYLPEIKNKKYQQDLIALNNNLKKYEKGSKAPNFEIEDLKGNIKSLEEFVGKTLVIDVWATWCAPCLAQAPYFEKYAYQYKYDPNIQFLAISIDDAKDKNKWKNMASKKSEKVKQYYANGKLFSKEYNIKRIPRFIMIDKNGNFLNANMSYPSDYKFIMELSDGHTSNFNINIFNN